MSSERGTPETMSAVTTSGDSIALYVSRDKTSPFGFHVSEIVHFTKSRRNGQRAVIRGVCKDGMLWFSVLPQDEALELSALPVQTTSCRGREEYIRQYGWVGEGISE
jgi:hypothetical protein